MYSIALAQTDLKARLKANEHTQQFLSGECISLLFYCP